MQAALWGRCGSGAREGSGLGKGARLKPHSSPLLSTAEADLLLFASPDGFPSLCLRPRFSVLQKRKKLLTEAAGDGEGRPDRSASTSGSSSSSSSGSDSDSDGGRRRRKSKKGKRDQKSKHKRKSSSKHKKRRSRDRSRERERGGAKALAHSDDYGRYGIIREADYFNKRSEFAQWAADVKKVDIELLGKADERELFKEFIEDYNTGTLPHKKYYDLELYERQAAAKEAGRKEKRKPGAGLLSDEEALRAERAAAREREAKERLAQAYAELQATDKAKDMKEQELLRRQMQIAYKTGDMVKAQQLLARLAPEDDTKKK